MANYIIENNNSLNFSLEILFTNSNLRSTEQGNLLWDNTKVHIELFETKRFWKRHWKKILEQFLETQQFFQLGINKHIWSKRQPLQINHTKLGTRLLKMKCAITNPSATSFKPNANMLNKG